MYIAVYPSYFIFKNINFVPGVLRLVSYVEVVLRNLWKVVQIFQRGSNLFSEISSGWSKFFSKISSGGSLFIKKLVLGGANFGGSNFTMTEPRDKVITCW